MVCDLVEGRRPAGILAYLDEECIYPRGTDKSFLEKMGRNLSKHAHFALAAPGKGQTRGEVTCFEVKHYAGTVRYDVAGFLDKNKDLLYRDMVELLGAGSTSAHVRALFPEAAVKTKKKPPTAGFQFAKQMRALVGKELMQCDPHYIRCIKPNDHKRPGARHFDDARVQHQVRYLGLCENVRVRRAGFAFRQPATLFVRRYKMLCPLTWPHSEEGATAFDDSAAILQMAGIGGQQYQFGKTKVFVRQAVTLFALEELRERKLHDLAAMIQSAYRAWKARKYFLELREKSLGVFSGRKRRGGSIRPSQFRGTPACNESAAFAQLRPS